VRGRATGAWTGDDVVTVVALYDPVEREREAYWLLVLNLVTPHLCAFTTQLKSLCERDMSETSASLGHSLFCGGLRPLT
jgi:hypothetical protein